MSPSGSRLNSQVAQLASLSLHPPPPQAWTPTAVATAREMPSSKKDPLICTILGHPCLQEICRCHLLLSCLTFPPWMCQLCSRVLAPLLAVLAVALHHLDARRRQPLWAPPTALWPCSRAALQTTSVRSRGGSPPSRAARKLPAACRLCLPTRCRLRSSQSCSMSAPASSKL